MKLFVIAPEGAHIARNVNKTNAPGMVSSNTPLEEMLQRSLAGASRRSLAEIFDADAAEPQKVMRLFE